MKAQFSKWWFRFTPCIFDNNSFLPQDLNIQSDKSELLKSVFKRYLSGLNILYLSEMASILKIFMMGLLLLQACHNRCHKSLPENNSYMTNDTDI